MPLHFEKTGTKYDRLSYIYERLSRSPDGIKIKDLANELGVSTKTIQRDLHDELSSSGVYCDGRLWKLKRSVAEDGLGSEDRIVLGILNSLAKHAGLTFYHKAHRLLEKVSCQLDHPLFANFDTELLQEEHFTIFTLLESAIKSSVVITTDYITPSKKVATFKLKPLRLAFFDGYWYLLAFDTEDNDKFKKFYLKSLKLIQLTDETFLLSKSIEERIDSAHSVWSSLDELFEVRLLVDNIIARDFERKPFHNQRIEGRDKDGSLEAVVKISHEMEIIPLIQWYLPHVRILEPKWIDDIVMENIATYAKSE